MLPDLPNASHYLWGGLSVKVNVLEALEDVVFVRRKYVEMCRTYAFMQGNESRRLFCLSRAVRVAIVIYEDFNG